MKQGRTHRTAPHPVVGLGLVALGLASLLMLSACKADEVTPLDRQEIEGFLEEYLPKLGQAYAKQDPSLLEGYAVPKEMTRIEVRTGELAAAGRVYEPELVEVTVEDVSVWNYSNAFVSTFEVWDIRSYTLGTHLLLQESLGQRNRVKYQLKRTDDGESWVVLYRELGETLDS